ncbi:hypothetical protein A7982_12517 [Minicystis rosea]|nr:hypothetical protein A7982_12517 [Minicystis rosea]
MAGEKTTKRKQKTTGGGDGGSALRLTSDPRKERRFEPKASTSAVISVVGLSVGAVLLGAGTYAQWLRAEPLGPHQAAPWLLLGGALLLIAIALFGPRAATPIRVGDAGIGREKDASDIERIEWRDVSRIVLAGGDALTIESPGTTFVVPLAQNPQAAACIVAEARARIPAKLEEVDAKSIPALDETEGTVLPLEAPQLAGARCKATDKLIAFEKDARLCGKCGEVYHKDAVPPKCLTCEAKLK